MADDPKAERGQAILKSLEQLHTKVDQLADKIVAAVKEALKNAEEEEEEY